MLPASLVLLLFIAAATASPLPQVCNLVPAFDVQAVSTRVFLDLFIVICVCRLIGILFRALGQPSVVGEIIAGILLGPSALGRPWPCPTGSAPCDSRNPTLVLFPTNAPCASGPNNVRNYLNVLAQLGIVVFMWIVGLEVDLDKLRRSSGKAAVIAIGSVATPFLIGMLVLGPHLYDSHSTITLPSGATVAVPRLTFNLFIGTSLSVTAFPVLARIIVDKAIQRLTLGTLTLTSAALNDVIAWTLLAVVLAVQKSQHEGGIGQSHASTAVAYGPVLAQLGWLCLIVLVMFTVVRPLMRVTVLRQFIATGTLSPNRLAWSLACMFLSAWLLHHVGFHAMLGSFIFGLAFPRGHGTPFLYTLLARVESFTVVVLLPLFFITVGLSIDLGELQTTGAGIDLLWIVLVASGGKLVGSTLPALLCGCGVRRSLAIGVLMNTRGLTEIVVLQIARQTAIIDASLFTMLVAMAVITTAVAGPLLSLIYPPSALLAERKAELSRKAVQKAVLPPSAPPSSGSPLPPHAKEDGTARVVVLLHDIRHVARLIDAAMATLAPGLKAFLAVAQFQRSSDGAGGNPASELGPGLLRSAGELAAKREIKAQLRDAEAVAAAHMQTHTEVRLCDDPGLEALAYIKAVAPQVVVTDWPEDAEARARLQGLATALVCAGHAAPTLVLWGGPDAMAETASPLAVRTISTSPPSQPRGQLLQQQEKEPEQPAASKEATQHTVAFQQRTLRNSFRGAVLLLHDADAQDAAVDAASAKLKSWATRAAECVPLRVRLFCASWCSVDEEDDGDDEEVEKESGTPPSPRVESTAAGAVVTRHTMAMGAAQSLSPKAGDKIVVCGWPRGADEVRQVAAFLQGVEHNAISRRASRRASLRPLERRPTLMPAASVLPRSPSEPEAISAVEETIEQDHV